jgi:hypothetical protein
MVRSGGFAADRFVDLGDLSAKVLGDLIGRFPGSESFIDFDG